MQPFERVVTDKATGKPLADVTIRARNGRDRLSVKTDAQGRYRLNGLPPGSHELKAFPASDQCYHVRVATAGKPANQLPVQCNFELVHGEWITGKVVNERTHEPVAAATIGYSPLADNKNRDAVPGLDRAAGFDPQVFSKDDGTFRIVGLPGKGVIAVQRGGFLTADQRTLPADVVKPGKMFVYTSPAIALLSYNGVAAVDIAPGKPSSPCVISLDPGATIKGRLLDPDGNPLTGVLTFAEQTWAQWRERPLPASEFVLRQMNPKQPRTIGFLHPEKELGAMFELKADAPEPIEVKPVPTATVSGRLVNAGGLPIIKAELDIMFRPPTSAMAGTNTLRPYTSRPTTTAASKPRAWCPDSLTTFATKIETSRDCSRQRM
jgi:hypothetical protein